MSAPTIESKYLSYQTIELRLYIEIADSMELDKLCIEGIPDTEECAERWEEIVAIHAKAQGNAEYIGYLKTFRNYYRMINEHTLIKAILTRLSLKFEQRWVDVLNLRRYRVDTSSQEAFQNSLERVEAQLASMEVQIALAKKELDDYGRGQGKGKKNESFEAIMANLCDALRREVPDNITLARYDEYCKIVKRKKKPADPYNNGRNK